MLLVKLFDLMKFQYFEIAILKSMLPWCYCLRFDDILFLPVSYYSLFPLLFEPREYPIKVTLLVLYSLVMWVLFSINFQSHNSEDTPSAGDSKYDHDDRLTEQGISVLGHGELAYMAGLILVEIYGQFFHNVAFKGALPFLPLMLTSVYCALGMLYIWIKQFLYVCNLR